MIYPAPRLTRSPLHPCSSSPDTRSTTACMHAGAPKPAACNIFWPHSPAISALCCLLIAALLCHATPCPSNSDPPQLKDDALHVIVTLQCFLRVRVCMDRIRPTCLQPLFQTRSHHRSARLMIDGGEHYYCSSESSYDILAAAKTAQGRDCLLTRRYDVFGPRRASCDFLRSL